MVRKLPELNLDYPESSRFAEGPSQILARVIFFFFCNIVDINLGSFLARKKVCYTTVNFHDQHADLHEFWVWGVELISLKSWDLVL